MDTQLESSSFTEKPSLFELFAQEELTDLLQPAVKYVLSVCGGGLSQVMADKHRY